jgi:hypothetical protein
MIIIYLIELFLGFDRNFLGYLGLIIVGIIGYLITKTYDGALLSITIGLFIINLIKVLFNIVINNI